MKYGKKNKIRPNPNYAVILSKIFPPDSFPDLWVIPAIMHMPNTNLLPGKVPERGVIV